MEAHVSCAYIYIGKKKKKKVEPAFIDRYLISLPLHKIQISFEQLRLKPLFKKINK